MNTLLRKRVTRLMSADPRKTPRLSIATAVLLVLAAFLVVPHVRARVEAVEAIESRESEQAPPNSDAVATVKTAPSKAAERRDADGESRDEDDEETANLPPIDRRVAALKAIQRAGGRAWADPGKHAANDLHNPKLPFFTAEFYRTPISDEVLEALSAFPEIQRLQLSESGITDDQLARLPQRNLKHLDLSYTPITDDGLRRLPQNARLDSLVLSRTAVTSKGLASLAPLQRLQQLILDRTAVDDAGMGYLAGLPKLAILSLNDTIIGDAALERLRSRATLTYLGLSRTRVTDAGLVSLQGLSKLATLQLEDTRVSDLGMEAIEHLSEIVDLRLDDTRTPAQRSTDPSAVDAGATIVIPQTFAGATALGQVPKVPRRRTLPSARWPQPIHAASLGFSRERIRCE